MRFVGRSFSKFFQSGTCPFASSLRDFLFIPAVFDAIAIACQGFEQSLKTASILLLHAARRHPAMDLVRKTLNVVRHP